MLAVLGRVFRLIHTYLLMARFYSVNRLSTRPVVAADGATIVSLTSHGARISRAYYSIESIGKGEALPGRIILWLDDPQAYNSPPSSLLRLKRRGLEIRMSENFGPHTKYYPYVRSISTHLNPLVTADDDVLYDRLWLKSLMEESTAFPDHVISHRAHFIELSAAGDILPYANWSPSVGSRISPRNFATGVSGVLYPPRFLNALRQTGEAFRKFAPKADDVWLHAVALRTGVKVKQVGEKPQHYPTIRGTQAANLWSTNVFGGGNDSQIRSTYSGDDLQRLQD